MFEKIKNNKDVILNQIYNASRFFVSIIISLLIIKLITSKLDPELYGIYRYVLAVISLCAISTITGFNKTISGYIAKGYHGTTKKIMKLSFKTGVIGIVALLIFGMYSLIYKQNIIESVLFFIGAIVFLPYTIFQRYESILTGLQRFKNLLLLHSTFIITQLLITAIVLLLLRKGILLFGISQLVIQSLMYIIFFIYSVKLLTNSKIDDGFFKHSIIISLVGLGDQIIAPGIQMYLNYVLGSSELAFFVIANRITRPVAGIIKPITRPISMKLTSKGKTHHNIILLKLMPLCFFSGLVLYGIFFLGINIFGPFFVSTQYSVCLFYAKLFGLKIILGPLYSLLSANLIFEKNNKAFSISLYAEQATRIIGYVLFVQKYGILAIALSNVTASIIRTLIMAFYIKKDINETLIKD